MPKLQKTYNEIQREVDRACDVRLNEITQIYELKHHKGNMPEDWQEIKDELAHTILHELRSSGISITKNTLYEILQRSDRTVYNPLKDYFRDAKAHYNANFAGKDLIGELADKFPTKNNKVGLHLKKWMVAAIAQVMGTVNDTYVASQTCFILQGAQGIGKSTFIRDLYPSRPELNRYRYAGEFEPDNEEHINHTCTHFFINLEEELERLLRVKKTAMKRAITMDAQTTRRKYRRDPTKYRRIASFIGSVNSKEVLEDTTGNRRYIVIELDDSPPRIEDNMALWGHAVQLFEDGYQYYYNKEETAELNEYNEAYRAQLHEEELIRQYIGHPDDPLNLKYQASLMTTTQICQELTKKHPDARIRQYNVVEVLNRLNFKQVIKHNRKMYHVVFDAEYETRIVSENKQALLEISEIKEDECPY